MELNRKGATIKTAKVIISLKNAAGLFVVERFVAEFFFLIVDC